MKRPHVVLYIATSLDGYIARKDGSVDWLFTDQDYGYADFYKGVDAVIMGRTTYDQCLTFGEFPYKDKPCYVYSKRMKDRNAEYVTFVDGDLALLLVRLHKEGKKKVWLVGGAELAHAYLKQELIDAFIISIHPVLLGEGILLFKEGFPKQILSFKHVESFDSGLVQLTYRRKY